VLALNAPTMRFGGFEMRIARMALLVAMLGAVLLFPASPVSAHNNTTCSHVAAKPTTGGSTIYAKMTITCQAAHQNYSITAALQRWNNATNRWETRVSDNDNPACTASYTTGCSKVVFQQGGCGMFRTYGFAAAVTSGNFTHVATRTSSTLTIAC
jgi:hypothetical protein